MFIAAMNTGESRDVQANGNYIQVDKGTKIEVVTDRGSRWTLGEREGVSVSEFRAFSITNLGANGDMIQIRFGYGQIKTAQDGQAVSIVGAVSVDDSTPIDVNITAQPAITVSATVNQSNQISTAPDVSTVAATATVIAAANAARKELMIKNPSSNAESVRIGGMNVAANRGFELEPGESTILTTTAAVYAYCSAVQPLSITELEFV